MLVLPNEITHGPAVNRGLDCTLSQSSLAAGSMTDRRPTSRCEAEGWRFMSPSKLPLSPADWARVRIDYHWSRPLTGFSARLLAPFTWQMVPDLLAALSRNRVVSQWQVDWDTGLPPLGRIPFSGCLFSPIDMFL